MKNRWFFVATNYTNGRPTGQLVSDPHQYQRVDGKELGYCTAKEAEARLRGITYVDDENSLQWK
jgi:hypothetical protein